MARKKNNGSVDITVVYNQYMFEKKRFFEKHGGNYECDIDYHYASYLFEDGATWYEEKSTVYEYAEVEIKKVHMEVQVKMLKTKYWNTDNSSKKYYYEKF